MWKNIAEWGRPHDNMAHAHCMLDTYGYTNTHTEYVIVIDFAPQQWLHERAPLLLYTYIHTYIHACIQKDTELFFKFIAVLTT